MQNDVTIEVRYPKLKKEFKLSLSRQFTVLQLMDKLRETEQIGDDKTIRLVCAG